MSDSMDIDNEALDLIAHVEETLLNKINHLELDVALVREEVTAKGQNSGLAKRAKVLEKENKHQNTKLEALTREVKELKKEFKNQQALIQQLEAEAVEKDVRSHLQTLKHKATLKTAIKTVGKSIKDRDSSEVMEYLFGANVEETWRCLRRIRDRAPFSEEDCRAVRDLLVKTNLFMRERWFAFGPAIPKSKHPVARDTLCFHLVAKFVPTDTSSTEELLKKDTDFKQSLSLITQLHTHKLISHKVKWSRRNNFSEFLFRVVNFIDAIQALDFLVDNSHARTVDDGLITIISEGEHRERFLYEVVEEVLPTENTKDPNNLVLEYHDIRVMVERLVGYMATNYCSYGMLTDGETMLFITYDFDTWNDLPIYDKTLPIEIHSTHINATSPSCVETMTSWILSMKQTWTSPQMAYELFAKNTNYNPKDALVLPTITDYFDILHEKRAPFQVYDVAADQITGFDHHLGPNQSVVLKIFDPNAVLSLANFSVRLKRMKQVYALERECAERLSKDPEFNNCYYDQGEVFAAVKESDYLCSGQCLISKYIPSCMLPNDEETYQKVKQQIEVVHRNKIVHNDIAARNIRYTPDKEVYLIDFGVSILDPDPDKYRKDYKDLNKLFADRNKPNKREYLT